MDICTLTVNYALGLAACFNPQTCHMSKDNTKQLCSTFGEPSKCPLPTPYYVCKRPDGTTYRITGEAVER